LDDARISLKYNDKKSQDKDFNWYQRY